MNITIPATYDGYVQNGYFYIASDDGRGTIVYDWNATPKKWDDGYLVAGTRGESMSGSSAQAIYRSFGDYVPEVFSGKPVTGNFKIKGFAVDGSVSISLKKLANLASSYSDSQLYSAINNGVNYSDASYSVVAEQWITIPLNSLALSDLRTNKRLSIGIQAVNESTGDNLATLNSLEVPFESYLEIDVITNPKLAPMRPIAMFRGYN